MRILIFIIVLTFIFACSTDAKKTKDIAKIEFEYQVYDLSKIKIKDSIMCVIKFWNKGNSSLIVNKVKPSCSCVRVDWPKEKIAKSCSGQIEAVYYTEHPSVFSEVIYTYYNGGDSPVLVTIKGVAEDK